MIPLSGGVLVAAAIVASPALWLSLVKQTMPIDVALTRYFIVLGIAWVALSILADFLTPSSTVRVEENVVEQDSDPQS
jgi:hypothetical protein